MSKYSKMGEHIIMIIKRPWKVSTQNKSRARTLMMLAKHLCSIFQNGFSVIKAMSNDEISPQKVSPELNTESLYRKPPFIHIIIKKIQVAIYVPI